ncbi:MAG: glycosyltransferase family 4 protein [Acidiferrobacterales bacterium]
MSRINVLWVIDHVCYDGNLHGGGRLYWNVLPRFDKNRVKIVPCMLRATEEIREIFKTSPVPPRVLDKGKYDLTTLWTFLRLIKSKDIHVMHLHCYGASFFGRLAGLITGVPTIIHDYDTAVYFPYPWYLRLADRVLAPFTSHAVAASPMVRDFFIQKRKIHESKIHLMLHAIPVEKYAPISRATLKRTRDQLKIGQGTRIVGTITKLGPQRGNKYLLRVAAHVVKVFPNVVFVLAYKPTVYHRAPSKKFIDFTRTDNEDTVTDLQSLVDELDIGKYVRFVEIVDNSDDLIGPFDVFVASFLSERFSSVNLLEAMAKGKGVIGTDVGEQTEIITSGTNGYLVPPGDEMSLATTLIDTLTRPKELDRLSRQASVSAERFSADSYARKLQSWYEELAANGRIKERKLMRPTGTD